MSQNVSHSIELASRGSAGALLAELSTRMQAENALEDHRIGGLIESLGYVPNKQSTDAIGTYQPGADKPQDIDVAASIASDTVQARKGRGHTGPNRLFVVTEFGHRYDGSTGAAPLHALARLSVAMAALATEKIGADMHSSVVPAGKRRAAEAGQNDSLWTLKRYDKQVAAVRNNRMPVDAGKTALASGLQALERNDELRPNSDVVLVVSDFLDGVERGQNGEIKGFTWENPLRGLHRALGDRLFAIRLNTPAQREMPASSHYSTPDGTFEMDESERASASERYARMATDKAGHIAQVLGRMRHMEFDSNSRRPTVELINFVFGEPKAG
jgi:hypothetical protein